MSKTKKIYSGKLSLDDLTGGRSSGLQIDEMPGGGMLGDASGSMAGLSEAEMSAGDMDKNGGSTSGEMPSGQMTKTATSTMSGTARTQMPAGEMAKGGDGNGLTITEMPTGPMTGDAAKPTNVKTSEKSESETGGLPTLEIAGEWRLILSSTSIKNS